MVFSLVLSLGIAATASYTLVVSEEGNALVMAEFLGEDILNVPLPLDVSDFQVTGAFYLPASNGIDLSLTQGTSAFVVYESSLLITENGDTLKFGMSLPSIETTVTVSFPKDTEIQNTIPDAQISQTENSVNVVWQLTGAAISAQYILKEEAQAFPIVSIFIAAIVIIALMVFALAYFKKKVTPPKTRTKVSGKSNVLKTLSENQKKIVKTLLENKSEMKRNKLERITGISKSSLAATLNQLERRKILEINKQGKVHYIRLTDWFMEL